MIYEVIATMKPFVCLLCSRILACSDSASSAKSIIIVFDDCSDVSEKTIHVTVPFFLIFLLPGFFYCFYYRFFYNS